MSKHIARKLTPKEYGKLQSFPMEHWEQVVSDNQAYKQFGNSVVVPLMTNVADLVVKKLNEMNQKK